MSTVRKINWNKGIQPEGVACLDHAGGMIVSPTKVGYIVMTTDVVGLDRKFKAKNRARNKPGVVLCGSLEQLEALAEVSPEILNFYRACWERDILIGCILPWKESGRAFIPDDGSVDLMSDARGTSCFVVRFGLPSEYVVRELWEEKRKLVFASSANPSGRGNRGLAAGIGESIEHETDLVIEADDYVASIQPGKREGERHEQGVMVSMVDQEGRLVPEQQGRRSTLPAPVLIRRGLDVDAIQTILSAQFHSWDYRHGQYY